MADAFLNGRRGAVYIGPPIDDEPASSLLLAISSLSTSDPQPPISGTISNPLALVDVTIDGINYPAVNNGNGTWTIAQGIVGPLVPGSYPMSAHAVLDGIDVYAVGTLTIGSVVVYAAGDGTTAYLAGDGTTAYRIGSN